MSPPLWGAGQGRGVSLPLVLVANYLCKTYACFDLCNMPLNIPLGLLESRRSQPFCCWGGANAVLLNLWVGTPAGVTQDPGRHGPVNAPFPLLSA